MTEITDGEVAEILWASSEAGKAAHRAAWDKAQALGVVADQAEIGAIVWAAHLAAKNAG